MVVDYSLGKLNRDATSLTGTVSLFEENEVRLATSESEQLVFGGQYLTVPSDTKMDLDVDFELEGGSDVMLRLGFRLQGYDYKVDAPALPPLVGGERGRISGNWIIGEEVHGLEAVMSAQLLGTNAIRLRFHRAVLSLKIRDRRHSGNNTKPISIWDVKGSPKSLRFSSATQGVYSTASCLSETKDNVGFTGINCQDGFLTYGPYASVSPGTSLRASTSIRVKRRRFALALELSTSAGNSRLSRSQ